MKKGRKRIVIFEKTHPKDISQHSFIRGLGLPLFINIDYIHKNRFILELESDKSFIDPARIQGFRMEVLDNKKTIKIKTIFHIDNWIDDFVDMNVVKISFLDTFGNEVKKFDFDIKYEGYTMECDYGDENLMTPVFLYNIFD